MLPMLPLRRLIPALSLLMLASAQAAPVRVEFWHAMGNVQDKVGAYVYEFNKSQSTYEVVAVPQGNYRELFPKLQTALKTGKAPALVQLEFTQFPVLAQSGQLIDLSRMVDTVPDSLSGDIYPSVWKSGQINGKTYGLPWNISVPVLMYNAGALRSTGQPVPTTWAQLEMVSRAIKGHTTRRPLVIAADAWTYEANVLSRGGRLIENGAPTLNSPDSLEALTQLARMSATGLAQPRSLNEVAAGAFDFARGKNHFILASVANWTDAKKIPFLELGVAPFLCEKVGTCAVPLGGAALSMPKGTSAQEQAGALAFWQFLMEPKRLADWVSVTAYVPPRRAAVPLLDGWYKQNESIREAHAQISRAVPRPTNPEYSSWIPLIEAAITKATTGKATAKAALDEAQHLAAK